MPPQPAQKPQPDENKSTSNPSTNSQLVNKSASVHVQESHKVNMKTSTSTILTSTTTAVSTSNNTVTKVVEVTDSSKSKSEQHHSAKNQASSNQKHPQQGAKESSPADTSTTTNTNSKLQQKHQPYATSLVNSGFGFGFDLQGGESDNQLTFIVNVQPNGDAARKGLADGKITYFFSFKTVLNWTFQKF